MATPEPLITNQLLIKCQSTRLFEQEQLLSLRRDIKKKLHFHDKGLCQQYFYIKIAVVRLDIKG